MMKALNVRQPWAWAIIHAGKDVENRSWHTNMRGRVAIHAAGTMTRQEYEAASNDIRQINHISHKTFLPARLLSFIGKADENSHREIDIPAYGNLVRGAIIGTVEIVDCVQESDSVWFGGPYGFILAQPKCLIEPIPCKGALGFWNVPPEVGSQMTQIISHRIE